MSAPAVVIAAPASGSGKTTLATGLIGALRRAGHRVAPFKVGPDYIDPGYHGLAAGRPGRNLDPVLVGQDRVVPLYRHGAQGCDIAIVEGVMGLFDGSPSAADLAERFGLPVLAVIDAQAMAGTFGALAYGLQNFRPALPWAGVLANRVAGERHAGMLQAALREPAQWLGALPRGGDFSLPERHLGLVAAHELGDAMARLDAAADALAATPLGQRAIGALPQVRFEAPRAEPEARCPRLLEGRTIAVARDAAFAFIYPANLDVLAALGARAVFFSPLAGDALPACDAAWLPGGYPELHAKALSACAALREALAAHAGAGKPVWAECGGMMALFDQLQTADGAAHALWGLLPGRVTMHKRLAALGPQQLRLGGHVLRGHTFHYSNAETSLTPATFTARPEVEPAAGARAGEAFYLHGSVRASYFHAWFASSPEATAMLFGAAPIAFERKTPKDDAHAHA